MIGRPSVTFTASWKCRSFSGISPWSWYIAITASNFAVHRLKEERVGRIRPARATPGAPRPRDRGRDDAPLLAAEEPVLTGVRIEAGDRDAGLRPGDDNGAGARRLS